MTIVVMGFFQTQRVLKCGIKPGEMYIICITCIYIYISLYLCVYIYIYIHACKPHKTCLQPVDINPQHHQPTTYNHAVDHQKRQSSESPISTAPRSRPIFSGPNCSHTIHVWWMYLPTWMVDFYGFHVGKYTSPMDPMGLKLRNIFCWIFLPDQKYSLEVSTASLG